MAQQAMSVTPYWELTFDADGDVDARRRDRLLAGVGQCGVHDLIVFSHGWNSDRSGATRLYSRFFEPFPRLAPQAHLGYVGVLWPSMRFSDEPIPDFPRSLAAAADGGPVLDEETRHALLETFPGRADVVGRIARMLEQRPPEEGALEEFGRLVRLLVDAVPPGAQAPFAADTVASGVPQDEPEMFAGPTAEVCDAFAAALCRPEAGGDRPAFGLPNPWDGAHELLRQATYYAMKRRAGTVGERGLGPLIGRLAAAVPGVRVHLVGHSFGARLVSFALRGLPRGVSTVKSVTLLQGAFSHYAFATRLPHDPRAGGVLQGQQNRVDGPLVCCFSRHDKALSTMYPLASRMSGDARGVLAEREAAGPGHAGHDDGPRTGGGTGAGGHAGGGTGAGGHAGGGTGAGGAVVAEFGVGDMLGAKWGAMGHDGVQAVPGTRAFPLAEALAGPLPVSGCVNIDAAAVVRRGGGPAGAHSDIVHPELARVVLAAGRIG